MADFTTQSASEALEEALREASHLTAADAAAVAVAREMAKRLDGGDAHVGECPECGHQPGAAAYDVQVYLQALKALTLDASSRMAASIEKVDKRSRVADMKAERERRRRNSA